jgi:hypothetical protein
MSTLIALYVPSSLGMAAIFFDEHLGQTPVDFMITSPGSDDWYSVIVHALPQQTHLDREDSHIRFQAAEIDSACESIRLKRKIVCSTSVPSFGESWYLSAGNIIDRQPKVCAFVQYNTNERMGIERIGIIAQQKFRRDFIVEWCNIVEHLAAISCVEGGWEWKGTASSYGEYHGC